MQINQQFAQLLALSERCGTAVDKGSGSPVRGNRPADEAFMTLEQGCSIEPRLRLREFFY